MLFLIAGVVFAFMLFFADSGEGAISQAMLMGSATTVIVLTLMAINALDNPYRSGVGTDQTGRDGAVAAHPRPRARRRERHGSASVRRPGRPGSS